MIVRSASALAAGIRATNRQEWSFTALIASFLLINRPIAAVQESGDEKDFQTGARRFMGGHRLRASSSDSAAAKHFGST